MQNYNFKHQDQVYIIELEQPFINWYGQINQYRGNGFYEVINQGGELIIIHQSQIELIK